MPSTNFHAEKWFIIGLGLIGAATRYFVALSRSPVVGIVLPLIFGLVGGAGGVYLAKADLKSEEGRHRLALIGKAVGSLSLVMVLATAVTLWWRNEASYQPLLSVAMPQQVALVGLRARLQILGASAAEKKSHSFNRREIGGKHHRYCVNAGAKTSSDCGAGN